MAKMTNRDNTIAGLEAIGFRLDPTARTSKYLVYRSPELNSYLIVGKSGALRAANGPISGSISWTGSVYHKALQHIGEQKESFSNVEQAREAFQKAREWLQIEKSKTK